MSMLWRHFNTPEVIWLGRRYCNGPQRWRQAATVFNVWLYGLFRVDRLFMKLWRMRSSGGTGRSAGNSGGQQVTVAAIRPQWWPSGHSGGQQVTVAAIRPQWWPSGHSDGQQFVIGISRPYSSLLGSSKYSKTDLVWWSALEISDCSFLTVFKMVGGERYFSIVYFFVGVLDAYSCIEDEKLMETFCTYVP